MVSITLSVPEELKKEMDMHPELNWSAVARQAIKNKIVFLKKFKEFAAHSTLTQEETIELGRKVNKTLAARYKKTVH